MSQSEQLRMALADARQGIKEAEYHELSGTDLVSLRLDSATVLVSEINRLRDVERTLLGISRILKETERELNVARAGLGSGPSKPTAEAAE